MIAAAALAVLVLAMLGWAIGRLGCEDAEEPDFNTVRCDGERGEGWRQVELVLLGAAWASLLAGVVWSFRHARYVGVVAGAAGMVGALVGLFAIENHALGSKEVPRVTALQVLETECRVPCADGFRVRVTVDIDAQLQLGIAPAEFDQIGGRQFNDLVDGEDAGEGTDVEAGTHEFRIGGEIINPPSERGPLPAGPYEIEVYARPQNAGNQENASSGTIKRPVVIRP